MVFMTGAVRARAPPVVDFEFLLGQYTGNAVVDRLLCVAERAEEDEVAREALAHAKRALEGKVDEFSLKPVTSNGAAYERAMTIATTRGVPTSTVAFTREWAEANAARADAELERLEANLADVRTERVKENLRMQYVELGDHYYDRGDLRNALTCYVRTREYCSTPNHIVFMSLNVVAVCLECENFSQVNLHANKAMSLLDTMDDQDETVGVTRAKLACARGIADLRLGRFKEAATRLTEIPVEIGTTFANVCTAKDVATYGTLCALASFDREELRSVLSNTRTGAFRAHLEAAADLREVLHNFYNSKYTACFSTLDNVRSTLALDIHLGAHIDALYECIRDRALIQYVKPYVTVDLTRAADSFSATTEEIQDEVTRLIRDGKIRARIDGNAKALRIIDEPSASTLLKHIAADGEKFEDETHAALLRLSLLRNDVIVRDARQHQQDDPRRRAQALTDC